MTDSTRPDLGAAFDAHMQHEFVDRDVDATMATMVPEPYVYNVPTMDGGDGWQGVHDFYKNRFVGSMPSDIGVVPVSRTIDDERVVDEVVLRFTHDVDMPWILPGVAPTGRKVVVPVAVVVRFSAGKVASEHIYWDQASVLKQVGLLGEGLPATGAEQADKLLGSA